MPEGIMPTGQRFPTRFVRYGNTCRKSRLRGAGNGLSMAEAPEAWAQDDVARRVELKGQSAAGGAGVLLVAYHRS